MPTGLSVSLCLLLGLYPAPCAKAGEWKFDFRAQPDPGSTPVPREQAYRPERGFGFVGANEGPAMFRLDLPEGNYDVTIGFGDGGRATSNTVKAEARRLMIEKIETAPGETVERTFTVNVRRPSIAGGTTVSLTDREKGPPIAPGWDESLTLEFNGSAPGVATLRVVPNERAITVYLAGDSTVTDQRHEPWAGWGQMLPRFFKQGVAVSNQAESGLALFSFEQQRRLEKILSTMKRGDYLFIQFGHNDQKDKREGAGPFTTYKANLKTFVKAFREKEGHPVLVTSMERRRWSGDEPQLTLADYAEAVRQVGTEEGVPVIDLHAMSVRLYRALGPEGSKNAFVFYPANSFPDQKEELKDNTHHNVYGGYELARCVVEELKYKVPELAKHLAEDAGTFDPARPDAFESIKIPPTPQTASTEKPAGN